MFHLQIPHHLFSSVLPSSVPTSLVWILSAGTLYLSLWLFGREKQPRLHLPVETPKPGRNGILDTVQECFEKHPDTPYLLALQRPIVILPARCIDDVKNLPEEKASLYDEVHIDLSQAVTGIGGGTDSPESLPAIRIELTRRLNSAVAPMLDELRYALDREFHLGSTATASGDHGDDDGDDDDDGWTTQAGMHSKLTRVLATVNSRIFVGRPLSRRTEWLEHTLGYSIDVMRARHALNKYPYYMKLLLGRFLPEVRRLYWHVRHGSKLLQPIVEQLKAHDRSHRPSTLSSEQQQDLVDDEFHDQQGTFCSWLLKYAVGEREDVSILILNQLALSFVSNHTIGYALSRVVFDLAARPEYLGPLRQEIDEAVRQDGYELDESGHKVLRKTTYVKLRKVDSFLRESQRLFPSKIVSMVRIARSPIALSTGHQLPTGTRFGIPVYPLHKSPRTYPASDLAGTDMEAEYVPPDRFDGYRYYKLRRLPGADAKHQFGSSTSNDALAFGLGAHCCPGRFYAATVLKVAFVELVRFWDVRLPGDTEAKGGSPPAVKINDFSLTTDPTAALEIRRRKIMA